MEAIFARALREGRSTLCEFEIYQLLSHLGIKTPDYLVITDPEELDETKLTNLGQNIVVKIVSPDIAHKQKLGGVKILKEWNLAQLKTVLVEMKNEVLSHFSPDKQPQINGFLLVEFIPYTPTLGQEIMIGYREDDQFGPLLLISKGGDDAEFFARNYDAANIILPPLTFAEALSHVEGLKISNKFREQGKEAYINLIADALAKVSTLANYYSTAAPHSPKYLLQSLDINPLVFTADRLVAIDGFGEFSVVDEAERELPQANPHNLEMFFRPQTVAVVGVSSDSSRPSMAREIAILLHSMGHKDIFLVNPRGGEITLHGETYRFYKSCSELPKSVDLVVYAAPISSTAQFIEALGDKAKAVIVISGLPATLKYEDFVAQLDRVKPKDLRILGPNCMGVYFAPDDLGKGVNTLFIEAKRLDLQHSTQSNTALLTQSGALALTAVDQMAQSRIFKTIVSFGNKYDVQITDLLAYFTEEHEIDLIALYIEGLSPGEGRLFLDLAQKSSKPIVVYKSGKTAAGAKAAASHTAALSGNYEVFRAACKQGGVILAERLEEYYDYIKVFSLLAKEKPQGKRVAAVFNAGFESTIAADELGGLEPAQLNPNTVARLREIDVHGLVDLSTSLLDVTPMADDQIFADFVETVLQDENVDCALVSIVPHSNALKSTPELCQEPDSLANLLIELNRKYNKPMVVSVNGGSIYTDFTQVMEVGGLAVFTNVQAATRALDTFVGYHLRR